MEDAAEKGLFRGTGGHGIPVTFKVTTRPLRPIVCGSTCACTAIDCTAWSLPTHGHRLFTVTSTVSAISP